jgi:hypothetical protein
MDTKSDKNILLDGEGVCNHCRRYENMFSTRVANGEAGKVVLDRLVNKIKHDFQYSLLSPIMKLPFYAELVFMPIAIATVYSLPAIFTFVTAFDSYTFAFNAS